MANKTTRVLILGGGFAGVYTGMYLERLLRRQSSANLEITLISAENYIVFQPLLPDVVSGAIELLHVVCPIRRLVRTARLYNRNIEHIDLDRKQVRLSQGFRPETVTLDYDHLVLGVGTVLDNSKVPGVREHALGFKHLGDALRLRNHLVHTLEEADIEPNAEERRRLLTFVVGGGGFSGVECMAEMQDFVRLATRVYRNIRLNECRFVLLQSADRILPELAPELAQVAHKVLTKRGIEIQLNTRLTAVSASQAAMQTKGGDQSVVIPSRTVVATVPSGTHPLLKVLPCKFERGRLLVTDRLQIGDRPEVWAVGDCAAIPQPDGSFSPPTAQHATRQAKICAANIAATILERPLKSFVFPGLGKLGSLGRGAAVAEVFGLKFSGWLAWLFWRGVYLSKMPGFDRKIRIFMDWLLDLFMPRDVTQVRIFEPDDVIQEHFEAGEIIFNQFNFGDKVYFISRGSVEVLRDGVAQARLQAGDCFGEVALVTNSPRGATIKAVTPVDVVSMSAEAFHRLIAHLPGMDATMRKIVEERLGMAAGNDAAVATIAQ